MRDTPTVLRMILLPVLALSMLAVHGSDPVLGATTDAPPVVIFSAFSAFAVIDAGQNEFAVLGSFTLGAGSTCCTADPLADSVTLQLGGFSTTIPGGSFNLNRHGTYLFQGAVPQAGGGTVMVWAAIRPEAGGKFGYAVGVRGANNLPSANPVAVILVVGSNAGSATANAYFLDNEE